MKDNSRNSILPVLREKFGKPSEDTLRNQKFQISLSPQAVTKPLASMIRSPEQIWSDLRRDERSFLQVYGEYFFVLSLIPALSGFIGYALVGNAPFGATAISALGGYFSCLLFVFLACVWAQASARLIGGGLSMDHSAKLVMYSLVPFFFTGFFLLHPVLAPFSLFGVYSAFLFFRGVETMTGIKSDKQVLYCVLNILMWIFFIERMLLILF
jgi:hypothetical protein